MLGWHDKRPYVMIHSQYKCYDKLNVNLEDKHNSKHKACKLSNPELT